MFNYKLVRGLVLAALILLLTLPGCCQSEPIPTKVFYDYSHTANGLVLGIGSDADASVVNAGNPAEQALRTGNGEAINNEDPDFYLLFRIDDDFLFEGSPTDRVEIQVEYLDKGTDTFLLQYDSQGGPFKNTIVIHKTDSGEFKTAVFMLCDAYFANRTNGGDFRIADTADGAETIRRVTVTKIGDTPGPQTILVDDCGADPYDNQPDSDAIQNCIDQACSGDTILFTSSDDSDGYQGYTIDKTIFLVKTSSKSNLTFSSTDEKNHALLKASPDLLGFVVHLYPRSKISDVGNIDNITINYLDFDGNRALRRCIGDDGIGNSFDDNWGSLLPYECHEVNDSWCNPGTLAITGEMDYTDPEQNYENNPSKWSTGLKIHDVTLSNTECGTALLFYGAASEIDSVIIDTAGDHVHVSGCEQTDPDEAKGAWADGITFSGPEIRVTNNKIMDASDIGIVSFGGRDTIISNNTIVARPGNNGMFAGIAVHPSLFGLLSGFQVVGNTVINEADTTCGGIHAGINIGNHMWGAGCMYNPAPGVVGLSEDPCSSLSLPPGYELCVEHQLCRAWGYVPAGETFTLTDNKVTGAQVNFLVEGLDVQRNYLGFGGLVVHGNISKTPQLTDWESDSGNCVLDGITYTWGALDRVAHDPTIEGWEDIPIYCER